MALPDFFVIGAPKAGTTALHAALARHPDLFLSPVKEPKYFLCEGRRPRRREHRGPGDAHSRKEWVWQRAAYESLFSGAAPGMLRGESTPFYLYDRTAHARMRAVVPHARLIAVLRDPVDRAYSNWMHLRSDGLEPIPHFLDALAAEDDRVKRGWAPFWRYRGLGLYGEQLADLLGAFPREQVHVLRYRNLVVDPQQALDSVCAFLGVRPLPAGAASAENVKPYVPRTRRNDALRAIVRSGAYAGQVLPPAYWRRASTPVVRLLHAGGTVRPPLTRQERMQAVQRFADDVRLLEQVLGASFADWTTDAPLGSFAARRAAVGPPRSAPDDVPAAQATRSVTRS